MSVSTLTLAEIVNRGMLAMSEPAYNPVEFRAAPVRNWKAPAQRDAAHRNRTQPMQSPETAHILQSADRLVDDIRTLGTLSDDPTAMRRHILRSLQFFLSDITSG
ncbi:MAG: hypothetical protein ACRCS9_15910 [Hyphomicrobium sp.]